VPLSSDLQSELSVVYEMLASKDAFQYRVSFMQPFKDESQTALFKDPVRTAL
jgi:hypothetical protein